jgi:hypothetical protein
MRYLFFTLVLLFFSPAVSKNRKVFDLFHTAYEQGDFNKLNQLLADNFICINEEGKEVDKKENYLNYLKVWSKTLDTKWHVEDIIEKKDTIFSTEYDTDVFNDYFIGTKHPLRFSYIFEKEKIKIIKWDSLPGHTHRKQQRNTKMEEFYLWVYKNHSNKLKYFSRMGKDSEATVELRELLAEYTKGLKG